MEKAPEAGKARRSGISMASSPAGSNRPANRKGWRRKRTKRKRPGLSSPGLFGVSGPIGEDTTLLLRVPQLTQSVLEFAARDFTAREPLAQQVLEDADHDSDGSLFAPRRAATSRPPSRPGAPATRSPVVKRPKYPPSQTRSSCFPSSSASATIASLVVGHNFHPKPAASQRPAGPLCLPRSALPSLLSTAAKA